MLAKGEKLIGQICLQGHAFFHEILLCSEFPKYNFVNFYKIKTNQSVSTWFSSKFRYHPIHANLLSGRGVNRYEKDSNYKLLGGKKKPI